MTVIIKSPLFYTVLTVACYLLSIYIHKKLKLHYLVPILIATVMLIGLLTFMGVDYSEYMTGGSIVIFFLGPATVSLSVPLYRQMKMFNRKKFLIFIAGISVGVLTAVTSVIVLSELTGLSDILKRSLFGKSVTLPIAVGICESAGGIVSVTIAGVIVAGITGAVCAPLIIRMTGVKEPISRGAAIGTASHIIGTVKAFEIGEKEGSVSSLSIGVAGIITACFVPVILLFM